MEPVFDQSIAQEIKSNKPPPRKKLREHLKDITKLKGNPTHIAFSFALGIFIGFSPFYGLHTIIALIFVYFFRLNALTTVVGAWVNMPFTAPFVYALCYAVGSWMSGSISKKTYVWTELNWELFWIRFGEIAWQITLGWIIIGTIASILGFLILRASIIYYRNIKSKR
ncbi:DUF2062 domain-containing protein [bacterium]|nr:DUF2062 domain-containing protein [candidate division CSSED10-310 bacterium]